MTPQLADPTDVRASAERRTAEAERKRFDDEQEIRDLLSVMGQPWGRRFIRRILARGNLTKSRYLPHNGDMARLEGQADLAIWLHSLAEQHGGDLYDLMIRERRNDNAGSRKDN